MRACARVKVCLTGGTTGTSLSPIPKIPVFRPMWAEWCVPLPVRENGTRSSVQPHRNPAEQGFHRFGAYHFCFTKTVHPSIGGHFVRFITRAGSELTEDGCIHRRDGPPLHLLDFPRARPVARPTPPSRVRNSMARRRRAKPLNLGVTLTAVVAPCASTVREPATEGAPRPTCDRPQRLERLLLPLVQQSSIRSGRVPRWNVLRRCNGLARHSAPGHARDWPSEAQLPISGNDWFTRRNPPLLRFEHGELV